MSVETTSTVVLMSGMSVGLDTTSQSGMSVNTESDAFTATLKEQFQLLNMANTATPAFTNTLTAQVAPGTGMQGIALLPKDQRIDLNPALQSTNSLFTPQNVLPNLAEPLTPVVAQPTLQSPVLQSLNTTLAPQNLLAGLVEPVAQGVTKPTLQGPVLQSVNTTLPAQNLLADLAEPLAPSVAKPTLQSPVLQSLNTTLSPANFKADLAEPLVASAAQPTLQSAVLPNPNAALSPQDKLPNLAEPAAPSVAQPTLQSPVLQSLNTALSSQNKLPDLVEPIATSTAQPKLNNPVLTVVNSEPLNQSPAAETLVGLFVQSDKTPEISTPSSKPLQASKKLEQELNVAMPPQTLTGVIAQILEVNSSPPVNPSLPQAPEAAAANTLDPTVTGLVQAAILQPVMSTPLNPGATKIELSAEGMSSPSALPDSAVPILNNAKSIPEGAKIVESTAPSAFLTELKASNNAVPNPFSLSDAITPKLSSTLDNLNVSAANATLDTGIAKSLSGLANELGAFDRSAPISGKGEVSPMTTHLYSPEWNKELGTKIVWMTNQNISSAELTLNPKHLGPISIHIDMQHDQASIAFTAQNAGVKEMLEASIPKLREMMQTQQLNLAEVNVSQNSFSGQGQANSPFFGQAGDGQKRTTPEQDYALDSNAPVNELEEQNEATQTLVTNGLVSLYA